MRTGNMLVHGQSMANEDSIGAIRVELSVAFIGDFNRRQALATIKRQRTRQDDMSIETKKRICSHCLGG